MGVAVCLFVCRGHTKDVTTGEVKLLLAEGMGVVVGVVGVGAHGA